MQSLWERVFWLGKDQWWTKFCWSVRYMEAQHNTSLYYSLRTFSYVELISADQFVNSFECEMLAHISSDIHIWMHNHMVTCLRRIQMYCCCSDTDFLVIRYPYFWRRVSLTRFLVVIDHLWRCVPWHNFILFLWVNWTAHWLDHSGELASCWEFYHQFHQFHHQYQIKKGNFFN